MADTDFLKNRIEQALEELPLTPQQIEHVIPQLVKILGFIHAERLDADSGLFDFKGKVETLVSLFAPEGLTLPDYLSAALDKPSLFYQSPETIENNIRALVKKFEAEGLTVKQYLPAALKQPSLFYRSPETIAGHINLVMDMYRKDKVRFKGEDAEGAEVAFSEHQSMKPLFDFLMKNPVILCLSDDNFGLRELEAGFSERPPKQQVLTQSRHVVEQYMRAGLGYADADQPVAKREDLHDNKGKWAKNMLMRALIREGMVKGLLAPDR